MTRLQFGAYLRTIAGRLYSVADEDAASDGQFRWVIVRRGKEESLVVQMQDSWISGLSSPPTTEDRMLVKHLAICIKRYFAHPESLQAPEFDWPGSVASRSALRLALDPRRWRKTQVSVDTQRSV